MFENAKIIVNPEYKELVDKILSKNEEEVRSLLDDVSKHLGEGNTARVRFLGSNHDICLKIYKQPEQIEDEIFYLSPEKEKEFLEKVDNLGTKIRVPKVYASFEMGENSGEEKRQQFLIMETLPAVSVDDVLQGRAKLPANFNWVAFQNDLLDFIEKMHKRNIYHRDMHEGNIMIDVNTFQGYVIDFGSSVEFWGEPGPGERGPYHVTKDGVERKLDSDIQTMRSVVKKLREKLTQTQ